MTCTLFSMGKDFLISALDSVQNKAAKFAHHSEGWDWESLAQCRKTARMCALYKVYTGERAWTHKDGAQPALFLIFVLFYVFFVLFYVFLCCSMYCLFCVILYIVCVYMCTELLPPGGYPIAVKYIILYHVSTSCHGKIYAILSPTCLTFQYKTTDILCNYADHLWV